jgi:tRNA dimethylallyltransferase
MQGIGYKETAMYLEGLISQKELERLLKRNTRRYAKRQYTWFSRYPDTTVIPVNETTDISAMASLIAKKFKK